MVRKRHKKHRSGLTQSQKLNIARRQEQVMLLNAQGFSIRQICTKLGIKSTETVHSDIKACIERINASTNFTTEQWRDIVLAECAEIADELATMKEETDKLPKVTKQAKIGIKLGIIESGFKNRDRVIKLRGLEAPQKLQHSGTFDFNVLREIAAKPEESNPPEVTGVA